MNNRCSRTCNVCGDVENRDATQYELTFKIAIRYLKQIVDGRWTGKYVCSRCYSKLRARMRRKRDVQIMPQKVQDCRSKHGIKLRIVRGIPTCIKGSNVVHQGIGCSGCEI